MEKMPLCSQNTSLLFSKIRMPRCSLPNLIRALIVTGGILGTVLYPSYQLFHSRPTFTPIYHVVPDYSVSREGPGENGTAVVLDEHEKVRAEQDMKQHLINLVASGKIDPDRSLPDVRRPQCKEVKYEVELPKASVILVFHEEPWSPLVRTVHSIINRTPTHYLQEIILYDDFSTLDHLGKTLEKYMERFGNVVKIVRSKERKGLSRARVEGSKAASGEVLIIMDSHCEVTQGWIEPILARIKEDRRRVVTPVVDSISDKDMSYDRWRDQVVSSFRWDMKAAFDPIQSNDPRTSPIHPIRSPVMIGCVFAVNREFFFEIGTFDPGLEIWGMENMEIGFKAWMCGGSLEILPCSHVAHLYRWGKRTYDKGKTDYYYRNVRRIVEVWLDEYKKYTYMYLRFTKTWNFGNITEQLNLRKRLKCKSFKWYMENVFPDKFVPARENLRAYGKVRNAETNYCLDDLEKKWAFKAGLYPCFPPEFNAPEYSQLFFLTKEGILRRESMCSSRTNNDFLNFNSDGCGALKNPFRHPNGSLLEISTGRCLDSEGIRKNEKVRLANCEEGKPSQKWIFENYVIT